MNKKEYKKVFGPFVNGTQLKEAMKILRRFFPYIDKDSIKRNNIEFYKQLGLVPDITAKERVSRKNLKHHGRAFLEIQAKHFKKLDSSLLKEYKNNIKNLTLFFEGKKKNIILNLKKEMLSLAKKDRKSVV